MYPSPTTKDSFSDVCRVDKIHKTDLDTFTVKERGRDIFSMNNRGEAIIT